MIDKINSERTAAGLAPLRENAALNAAAQKYADKSTAEGRLDHKDRMADRMNAEKFWRNVARPADKRENPLRQRRSSQQRPPPSPNMAKGHRLQREQNKNRKPSRRQKVRSHACLLRLARVRRTAHRQIKLTGNPTELTV